MEITFRTRRLARTFNSQEALVRRYGARMARAIGMRLAVLKNADNLSLAPITRPERLHQLTGRRQGRFAVDLVHPYRLIFVPNHHPVPRVEDGGLDRSMVTSITVEEVTDYH